MFKERFLQESIISSREDIKSNFLEKGDICSNLENWDKDKYNILFITGLSGSGKTTLGTDMRKEFKCKRVELDYVGAFYMKRNGVFKKDKFYNLLKEECPEAVEFFDNNRDTWTIEKWSECIPLTKEFLDWFVSKVEGNGQLYIVNGAQIPDVYDVEYFKERPIIVKDSNILKSVIRRTHREIDDEENLLKRITQFARHIKMITRPGYIQGSIRMTKYAKDIRNESYIEESENIQYTSSFKDVKNIVDSLNKEDLNYICNGEFKNSPYIIYRNVLIYNNDPASFIDIYRLPEDRKSVV